jgi:hypothetical protein
LKPEKRQQRMGRRRVASPVPHQHLQQANGLETEFLADDNKPVMRTVTLRE